MLRFVLSRLLLVIPTFLGIIFLTFVLIHLVPGDPVQLMLGEKVIDPARHAAFLHQMGLDQPLYMQFLHYVWQVMQGDLGHSIVTKQPVLTEFLTLFPATLELSICAMRSEEHTSELQSRENLVCRLLLEKKKKKINTEFYETKKKKKNKRN